MNVFNWKKGALAALAGFLVGLVAFLILFGNPLSQSIIYEPGSGQSQKLIDMWTTIEPLPALTPFFSDLFAFSPRKLLVMALLYLWAFGLVGLYAFMRPLLTGSPGRQSLIFGSIIMLNFFFFEVFAPFNLLGEPFWIVVYELILEAIIAFSVSWTIVKVYGEG